MKTEERPVIIVQGSSSGLLFVQECRNRGIEPIVVNPPEVNPDRVAFNKFAGKIRIIDMKSYDQYDEVLEKVRKLDPQCVVCGSSGGVTVADRLARDLGLNGNDPETTALRDTKDGMHRALKNAGLRYIRTAVVKSKKDVETFWKTNKIKKAMMKFSTGAGAVGNKACLSIQESLDNLDSFMKGKNIFGNDDNILIQEFIEGDEYVVDTVSCDGKHAICAIWKYKKMVSPEGDIVTDETNLITHPQPGHTKLLSYAFSVLDATGFRYGVCHGEYKVDENGPVLIETNARPHGATLTTEYLDEILPNHITDVALDSYLSPGDFESYRSRMYRPLKHATFKHLFSPKDCNLNPVMLNKTLGMMESYRYSTTDFKDETMHIQKTTDIETSPGILKLCNSDYIKLRKDCNLLYQLETKYFDLLEKGNDVVRRTDIAANIDDGLKGFKPYWNVLLVTEREQSLFRDGKKRKIPDDITKFDALVYADASEATVAERLTSVAANAKRICQSGVVVVVPEVYRNLPYGSASVEFVLQLAGCTIDVPLQRFNGAVLATRY